MEVAVLLIWGFKGYSKLLGIMTFVCGHCQNPAAQRITEYTRKFTFFFIPLFTVKRQVAITCSFCGSEGVVPKEHVEQVKADLAAQQSPTPAPAVEAPNAQQLPSSDH